MAGYGKEVPSSGTVQTNPSVFRSIFNSESEGRSLDSMVGWTRAVSAALPLEYRNVLLFNTPTGLRPDEALKAIYLVKTNESEYLGRSKDTKALPVSEPFKGKQRTLTQVLSTGTFRE
jgi:hypothetical protein